MKELDFHEDTKTIRAWLKGRTVMTNMLFQELKDWAEWVKSTMDDEGQQQKDVEGLQK